MSPIKSNALCLTNSSENLSPSLFKTLVSSKTIALSKLPPKIKPFFLSSFTSLRKPKVLAEQI